MSQQLIPAILALIPFGVIGAIRYGAYILKLILSSRWHDIKAQGELPYSLVGIAVTVKGEPPATFQMVLDSLLRERLDQVCITFDKGEHELIALTERFVEEHQGEIDLRWKIVYEKGKRAGLHAAIDMVEGMDIVVCMDSDTIFGEGVKQSILEAFSKPGIGGVTVKQAVFHPQTLMHYLFDIRLRLRYSIEAPGQAISGNMSCLSGRCSAYLAEPLRLISPNLVNESWMGIRKTGGGEDKCLTTFLQDLGYKCAFIHDSVVYTRPESSFKVYVSQSLRWARNSWFSDLRAIFQRKPWMIYNPIILFYTLDRMMSTFTLAIALWYMTILILKHNFLAVGLLGLWWVISRGIKLLPYLLETRRWWIVPPYALFSIFLSIVKIHALVTLWETGWLTRGNSNTGGGAGVKKTGKFSKAFLTNLYRCITAVIMLILGFIAFRSGDVWFADFPGIAEVGHFYRPGQTGLTVMQNIFGEQRTTLIAFSDPNNLDALNAALPDVARMGEEISRQADYIKVVKTSSLTESDVDVSNLIVMGTPSEDGPLGHTIAAMYDYPQQNESLLNAEPFAEGVDNPIRITHAPWDVNDWVVLAGDSAKQRYRLRGQILAPSEARVVMQNELGSAFFEPLEINRQNAVTLEHLDNVAITTFANETDLLQHQYLLIATENIDLSQLVLNVNAKAISALEDGTQLSVELNTNLLGAVKLDKSATQPVKFSLSAAADIVAADPTKPLILDISFPASAVLGGNAAYDLLWQEIEAYSFLQWQTRRPDSITLASYPLPYLSMQATVPTTIILPDSPTESELNELIRLVAFLGANGHPVNDFHVMTPSTLDEAVLAASNVIVLGSVERQALSQVLSAQGNEIAGVGVQSVLPTLEAGLIWSAVSPWNADHQIVVATGATESGAIRASRALERTTLLTDSSVMGAIIRPDGIPVPFSGFDQVALPKSIKDITVANAAVPANPSPQISN